LYICRMRLWSIHPSYLDSKGLVALWREALLAQAVLAGRTRGYLHHPQLTRFRSQSDPLRAIRSYLGGVLAEAGRRGYSFDGTRIDGHKPKGETQATAIEVTSGQLDYELRLLRAKLGARDLPALALIEEEIRLRPHPIFREIPGEIEGWERPKRLER